MAGSIRLDRFLTDMGVGTRSQVKEMARRGRIQVNGTAVKKTDVRIEPDRDVVVCDGCRVEYVGMEYYMLNKPQGVVSATEDKLHETVLDVLRKHPPKEADGIHEEEDGRGTWELKRKDLFPVGRLDIDTEGLLLITNDGDLAHRLLSPRRHVDKTYFAKVEGYLPGDVRERFAEGLALGDGTRLMAASLEIGDTFCGEGLAVATDVVLTIREGKFHQVKRMFEAVGCRVVFLKRLSMGSLLLDERLKPGEYRRLTKEELDRLKGLE